QVTPAVSPAVGHADEAAQQPDPLRLQRSVVQIVTSVAPAHLRIGEESRRWARQIAQPDFEPGRLVEPGDRVAALDSTRDPRSASARKGNAAPGGRELFRQLASCLAAAHDEHVPRRERGRVRVVFSVDDVDGGWKLSGCRWSMCLLVSAGGEDDTFRADLTRGRSEEEGSILRHLEAGHRHTFAHRRPKTLRVGDKVTNDLLLCHEPVRSVATVPCTGQMHRTVGNDKAEAVPAPTPRLANPS